MLQEPDCEFWVKIEDVLKVGHHDLVKVAVAERAHAVVGLVHRRPAAFFIIRVLAEYVVFT